MPSSPEIYPMTVEQQSMWLDDHMGAGPSRYVESWVCHLRGAVDRAALRHALDGIVARHEALRSRFVLDDDRLVQVVLPQGHGPELEHLACPASTLDDTLRDLVRRPMDVAVSAVRATLVEVADAAPETVVLVLQLHHLVIDDWALQTLEREFEEHYRAYVEQRAAALAPVPLQPGAYAAAQQSAVRDPAVLAYWRANLRDLASDAGSTLAPGTASAQGNRSDRGDRLAFSLDAAAAKRVRTLCRRARVTTFAVFAAAVAVLLHSVRGTQDVIVGTPVSHRGSADRDQVIAPLSELLPLRLAAHPDDSFTDLVGQVRGRVHEALTYKEVSYSELAGMVRRRGVPGGRELCRTVLVVDDAQPSGIDLPGVEARRIYVHSGVSKFDLCFTLVAEGRGYLGFLEYAVDLFSAEQAARVVEEFTALLERAAEDPDGPLSRLAGGVARAGLG